MRINQHEQDDLKRTNQGSEAAQNRDSAMQLNIDCQVTDETIVSLKRHNDELRQRLGHEIDQGHQLDRSVRALEADLAHIEREE